VLVVGMLDEPECGCLELVVTVVGAERGAVWRAQMAHARHGSGTLGVGLTMMSTVDLVAFVLAALPPPPARVLEVGCGAGALARALDDAGYRVLAIDPQAPEGPIFRRTTLEKVDEAEPFEAALASYSLHHVERLDPALDRLVSLLEPQGKLILEEFGWDRLDQRTAEWYARQQGKRPVESVRAEWRAEHVGLHGYGEMRRGLDERFAEHSFEWRPYLYGCLEREGLEAREREAIAGSEIQAVGFRYVGLRR
jgi:SAM-dependent methyltransferase